MLGGLALVLLAGILAACGAGVEFSLPCAVLGAVSLAATMLRAEAGQRLLKYLLRPAFGWGFVLMTSLGAAVYVRHAARASLEPEDMPAPAATAFHFLEEIVAITDRGRELPLCAYDDSDTLLEQELGQINLQQYEHQLIRLAPPSAECNCHGWVYTGGRFAIRSRDVQALLDDNGYAVAAEPQAGDLVIYRDSAGQIGHTGLVRLVRGQDCVMVESKWGPLGVYLHPVKAQPYGDRYQFHRSPRDGHLVAIMPTFSLPPAEAILARGDLVLPDAAADPVYSAARGRPVKRQIFDRPTLRVPGQRKS
jgi:hypothetical protein